VYRQRFKRENSSQQITEAGSRVRGQSSNSYVSEVVGSVVILNSRLHVRE
jgi:hypothetical protein